MNNKKWSAMTSKDKFEFLSSGQKVVKSETGLNGSAKVGDHENAMITIHWVEIGKVVVSHKHVDAKEALEEATRTILYWGRES